VRQVGYDAVQSLENELNKQLVRLPPSVRKMSLKQYRDAYGGDVNEVLLADIQRRLAASGVLGNPEATPANAAVHEQTPAQTVTKTGKRKAQILPSSAGGPAASVGKRKKGSNPGTPATPAACITPLRAGERPPASGERVVSENGSPLGTYEELTDEPQATGHSVRIVDDGSMKVCTKDGTEVELRNEADVTEESYTILQSLQENLNGFIARLTGQRKGG